MKSPLGIRMFVPKLNSGSMSSSTRPQQLWLVSHTVVAKRNTPGRPYLRK